MLYTPGMGDSFEALAAELAARDRDLPGRLRAAREAAAALRERAAGSIDAFCGRARELGADHLADLAVGPVEPDVKHVDCIQFEVSRGRWAVTCVVKAKGLVTLVGPFRRGKAETPCSDHPAAGPEVETALDERLLALIRAASER